MSFALSAIFSYLLFCQIANKPTKIVAIALSAPPIIEAVLVLIAFSKQNDMAMQTTRNAIIHQTPFLKFITLFFIISFSLSSIDLISCLVYKTKIEGNIPSILYYQSIITALHSLFPLPLTRFLLRPRLPDAARPPRRPRAYLRLPASNARPACFWKARSPDRSGDG